MSTIRVGTVVVNVADMSRAITFWCEALDYRTREREVDPEFMMLEPVTGDGIPVSLQYSADRPTQPVRVHLDLYTDDQEGQVTRLVDLGASRVPEWRYPADADFVVLRDPDGNEFCVIPHL